MLPPGGSVSTRVSLDSVAGLATLAESVVEFVTPASGTIRLTGTTLRVVSYLLAELRSPRDYFDCTLSDLVFMVATSDLTVC